MSTAISTEQNRNEVYSVLNERAIESAMTTSSKEKMKLLDEVIVNGGEGRERKWKKFIFNAICCKKTRKKDILNICIHRFRREDQSVEPSAMSNSKKREVLERYRNLLENNLVLTDDLLRWLKEKKALPDFVFDEVKVRRSTCTSIWFVAFF